ncbi:MAG: hypothetical protein Q8L07_04185 [Sediminibacterium sp.]|nr:hypothetical protein [Sediminibacterium sp.]
MLQTKQIGLFDQAPPPLFIYPTELGKIYTHLTTRAGMYYRYNILRKLLNKRKNQLITVAELADWEDVPVEDIILRITH